MPRPSNLTTLAESRNQAAAETRKLLLQHTSDIFTPNYLPIEAIIEMQKLVGYKPGSNARPRKQAPFSSTELPRMIAGGIETPSWFRYANMGEEVDGAPRVPEGYEWDVEYHRREDFSLATRPHLAEVPKKNITAKEKAEASFKRATRSMRVQADLTDDGIEDVSSDEELYSRRSVMVPSENSESSDDSADIMIDLESPGLLTRSGRSAGSRASSSVSASATPSKRPLSSPGGSRVPKRRRTVGVAGPFNVAGTMGGLGARMRVDSRHASTTGNFDVSEDFEDFDADVEENGDESGDDEDEDEDEDEDVDVDDEELVDAAALDDEDDEDWQ